MIPSAQDGVAPDAQAVLDFWFPEEALPHIDPEIHRRHWAWRMRGAADAAIVAQFSGLTTAAAGGTLDYWAETPYGRLALIILLDQFSRALWRDDPLAYAQGSCGAGIGARGACERTL